MTISTDLSLLHDPRRQARLLFWQGFSVPQIADTLQVKRPTVQSWKQRDGWDSVAPISRGNDARGAPDPALCKA